jgi:hypothetical protein
MTLELAELVALTGRQSSLGRIYIQVPFTGNRLSVHLQINPNLDRVNTVIGVLSQYFTGHRQDYQLRASQTVLELALPQTDFLSFFPISTLYDEYGLSLSYTTVGATTMTGSTTLILPENLAVLPDKVAVLEALTGGHETRLDGIDTAIAELEALPTSVSWESITDKPLTFNPATHSHVIGDISGLEGLTNNGNITATLLAANTTLESNKQYFSTVANLVCTLPSSPSIGDVIHLSTGNYSLRVNHGNASQQVLNGSTLTVAGTLNGIILKPYADISLMFLGASLWKTSYRIRTINNWVDSFTETVASIKPYTVEALEAYTYNASGNNPSFIADGNKTTSGLMRSGGGTLGELRLRLTFPYPTLLTSFNYWLGQFNGAFNMPTSVDVYTGATVTPTNLKGAISLSGASGVRSIANSEYASQYVFNFKLSGSGSISVLELETVGTQIISGEIVVS